jgi:hypothetical protein
VYIFLRHRILFYNCKSSDHMLTGTENSFSTNFLDKDLSVYDKGLNIKIKPILNMPAYNLKLVCFSMLRYNIIL